MTVDITDSLAPASDQLDAIELAASGPRTFTVESVNKGSIEQPVEVRLVGFPRVWRPSKGMRRALAAGWTVDASTWTGRRLTLYCDPDVMFGKDRTGGTRISHMSDLPGNKPLSVPLLITRGKSATFTVQPLADEAPAPDYLAEAKQATELAQVQAIWQRAKTAGHMTEALNAALKPIGEALKTQPAPDEATLPGTENDQ